MNTTSQMHRIMAEVFRHGDQPAFVYAGAVPYAILQAGAKFAGRDRRRIKRETNKAVKAARRKARL